MKRLSLVVISLLIFLFQTIAQEQVHDHANLNSKISREQGYYGRHISLKNGFYKIFENNKWRILDRKKKPISDFFYEAVDDYSYSMLAVKANGKWGYLNEKGKLIIDCEYSVAARFNSKVTTVKRDNKWLLIDQGGRIVKELDIDYCWGFDNNKAKVSKKGKSAWIGLAGNILPPGWMDESKKNNITFRTPSTLGTSTFSCPENISFESGSLNGWEYFEGYTLAQNNSGCVCVDLDAGYGLSTPFPTCSPNCNNIIRMYSSTPVAPNPTRYNIISKQTSTNVDPYGGFSINPPDGSNFAVKLGNDQPVQLPGYNPAPSARSERIRYKIRIPSNPDNFFVVFQYAVVYEEPIAGDYFDAAGNYVFTVPAHADYDHPRFTAKVIDPITNLADPCANFDFNSSDPAGFSESPNLGGGGTTKILYKPWERVFVDLSKYPPDKELYLEFTTGDCTLGGHWGYAYVDVESCNLNLSAQNSCKANETILSATPGFKNYIWRDASNNIIGQGPTITKRPALPDNALVKVELIPFSVSGCTTSGTVLVTRPTPPAVDLGNDKAICKGKSITIGVEPQTNFTYSWSPSTGVTNPNPSKITVSPTAQTDYTLKVTDNSTGCFNASTISINVENPPVLSVNSASICEGTSTTLTVTGSNNYTWSPTPLRNNTPNGSSVTVSPSVTTNYTVTGATSPNGCEGSAIAKVTVIPSPSLSVNSESICPGRTATLNVTGANSYSWSPKPQSSASSDSSSVSVSPTTTTIYTVTGNSTSNSCQAKATSIVTIFPAPSVELGPDKSICKGDPAISIGVPTSATLNYIWTSSTPIPSPNQSQISVSPSDNTKYFLTATDKSTGCETKDDITVKVTPLPVLKVDTTGICPGGNTVLNVSGASDYVWSPAPQRINTSNGSSVTVAPASTTVYEITGRELPSGCSSKTKTTVTVHPLPQGNISVAGNVNFICEGSSVILTASGGSTYQWYLNNALLQGATTSQLEAKQTGTYSVELISPFECKNRTASTPAFSLIQKPTADFRPPFGCVGNPISFTNISQTAFAGPVRYDWDLGGGASSTQVNPTFIYSSGGAYNVKLTITPTQCPQLAQTVSKIVLIEKARDGMRYNDVNTLINTNTSLSARPFGNQYLWEPSVGLNNYTIARPLFNYDKDTEYTIRIGTASGCETVDTVRLRMFNSSDIYVPSAFSPNGDGANDRLDVFLVGIKELIMFRVFNRWGQLLFETSDPRQLWDGKFKNIEQPLETYVWIAEARDYNGQIIKKRGQTILIR